MDDESGKGGGSYLTDLSSRDPKVTVETILVQPFFMLKIQCRL